MMLLALSEHAAPAAGGGHGQLDFMGALFVFMLATFIGVMVIQRVSRLLHTPLMSLTNAISSTSDGFELFIVSSSLWTRISKSESRVSAERCSA